MEEEGSSLGSVNHGSSLCHFEKSIAGGCRPDTFSKPVTSSWTTTIPSLALFAEVFILRRVALESKDQLHVTASVINTELR